MAVGKESYFWHKLHSLTGIIPIGYYLVQHLTLNSFALGGADKFNGVVYFFEGMPKHVIYTLKFGFIWLPLIFHAVYGIFITKRGDENYSSAAYRYRENRFWLLQRISGIVAFLFLIYHMSSTSMWAFIRTNILNDTDPIDHILYASWADKLGMESPVFPFFLLIVYIVGLVASSYHFSYGLWNFCIRWGITISDKAQANMAKVAAGSFGILTLLGCLALLGFFWAPFAPKEGHEEPTSVSAPIETAPANY